MRKRWKRRRTNGVASATVDRGLRCSIMLALSLNRTKGVLVRADVVR